MRCGDSRSGKERSRKRWLNLNEKCFMNEKPINKIIPEIEFRGIIFLLIII